MPFTVSHAAAVLPLVKRGPLVGAALVAGSMAPDVPFFLESLLPGSYRFGGLAHRPWAVPTVDVAIAAGLVGVWHGLVREPLVSLLPPEQADRAEALTGLGKPSLRPADAVWFAASAAAGAATHLGWDSFTHHGRAGVRLLPALERRVAGVAVHDILQYGTSLVGLGLLAAYSRRELAQAVPAARRREPSRRERRAALAGIGAATAAGAVHRVARETRGARRADATGAARGRRRMPLGSLVASVCFGAGAGTTVGAAGYAAVVRRARAAAGRS
ncbi:DUF4184 family protein [Phaeacidiphilus oryzae]|uniref:DUF4184 family protein n=1 Tax=Phaeacidiphilus oryzae TaxID=348818 RepID=UPI00055DEB3B|nr:DUF4184 family protein [Phaeacidiphilus oryzae]